MPVLEIIFIKYKGNYYPQAKKAHKGQQILRKIDPSRSRFKPDSEEKGENNNYDIDKENENFIFSFHLFLYFIKKYLITFLIF